MAKKKKQLKKKQQSKKKSSKNKKPSKSSSSSPTSAGSEYEGVGGFMSGMRSGMQDVAAGQSRWWDVFLWVLLAFALLALAYRMGWIGEQAKPKPQIQKKDTRPSRGIRVKMPVRTGVAPAHTKAPTQAKSAARLKAASKQRALPLPRRMIPKPKKK